jgi:hypothetical protein
MEKSHLLPIILQIQQWSSFLSKNGVQIDQNASSLAHHASNNKNKIIAHLTSHGNAHFGPTQ